MARPRKPAGSTKGDSLTIRIRPRVKFGLELLARKQRRSISDVVETLVIKGTAEAFAQPLPPGADSEIPTNLIDHLWAPTESERLVNMAHLLPDLMNYEEELRWKLIRKASVLWRQLPGFKEDEASEAYGLGFGPEMNWFPDGEACFNLKLFGDPIISKDGNSAVFSYLDMKALEKAWPEIIKAASDEISERQLYEALYELIPPSPAFTLNASGG